MKLQTVQTHILCILNMAQGGGTGDQVTTPAATNQGPTNGTVSWTPTVPGVYYYQCSAHLVTCLVQ